MIVSIIVPIYNAEQYLEECLDSISKCLCTDMECILVDDASTDCSSEISERYVKRDKRYKVIRQEENKGVGSARNKGLEVAQGEWVLFMDADDILDQDVWEGHLSLLSEMRWDIVVFSYKTFLDIREEALLETFVEVDGETEDLGILWKMALASSSLNTCWAKLFRRDLIQDYDIRFPEAMKTGEDTLFVLSYLGHVEKCHIFNDGLIYYRQHETSLMRTIDVETKLRDIEMISHARSIFLNNLQVGGLQREIFRDSMYKELFSMITDLMLQETRNKKENILERYRGILEKKVVMETMNNLGGFQGLRLYKKIEYIGMRHKYMKLLEIYFNTKLWIGGRIRHE